MMNYGMMNGSSGSGLMLLAWIPYVLLVALLILGIAALWKYLKK